MSMLLPGAAVAQERLWADVNFGVAMPTDKDLTNSSTRAISSEQASFTADYFWPRGPVFDVGAGFMLTPQFGVGVSVSRSTHSDFPVLEATIPHPILFNRFGTGTAEGDTELKRTETALHLQAMFVAFETETQRVRIFGGPTYMKVKTETVADFVYSQTFTIVPVTNNVTITDYSINECECGGWGFNLGADYSYFFTPNVGVGGILRFSRVKVEPVDFSGAFDLTAGGTAIGGGLRLKF